MIGWCHHDLYLRLLQFRLLPPSHLLHPVLRHHSVVLHPLRHAHGDEPGDVGLQLGQTGDCVQVKMVIMIVADDHGGDAR